MKKLILPLFFLTLLLLLTSCDVLATLDLPFLTGGETTATTTAACQHSFGDWATRTEPTCAAKGERFRTCAACGKEESEEIAATEDHTVVTDAAVPATCTKTGLTEGTHCSVCKTVLTAQEEVSTLRHKYVKPTRTEATPVGYITLECECGAANHKALDKWYKGKVIACIGDSITKAEVGGVTADKNDYVTLLAEALELDAYIRLGHNGSTLCDGGPRHCNIDKLTAENIGDADIVTIFQGVNDWSQTTADYYSLGTPDSTDTKTIYGAMKMWCERIEELRALPKYKYTEFYFITPVITSYNRSVTEERYWDQSKESMHGYTLRDICNAIIEVAEAYGVGVIDLNLISGIYHVDASTSNVATMYNDGIHPLPAGHALMAKAIENVLLDKHRMNDHDHTFGPAIITDYKTGEAHRVCTVCSATERVE